MRIHWDTVIEELPNTAEPVLAVSRDELYPLSGSPLKRLDKLRGAIRQEFSRGLHLDEGIDRLMSDEPRQPVRMGLYFPSREVIWEQRPMTTEENNPVAAMMRSLLTFQQVLESLPKEGLRPATLDELVDYLAVDPGVLQFRPVTALGTRVEKDQVSYFPSAGLLIEAMLRLAPAITCHKGPSLVGRKLNTAAFFLVVRA